MHNDYILESLHGGVLDIHVGVHTVPDQGLHDGVLRRREVEVSPELKMSIKSYFLQIFRTCQTHPDKLFPNVGLVVGVRVVGVHELDGVEDPDGVEGVVVLVDVVLHHDVEEGPAHRVIWGYGLVRI